MPIKLSLVFVKKYQDPDHSYQPHHNPYQTHHHSYQRYYYQTHHHSYPHHSYQPHNTSYQPHHERSITTKLIIEDVAKEKKGISLRRVMGAPKTGCKSCRG